MLKQNIVLLHGALGCKTQLRQLKLLLSSEFNVFDLNFEGHGDRESENEFSIELFSNNLGELIHQLNLSKTHIFGYSMGGYVALHFALNHPDLVDHIITIGTKFDWNKEIAAKEVKMLDPSKIEEKVPAFAQHLDTMHTAQSWKLVMEKTAQMMIGLGNGHKLNVSDLRAIKHRVLIGIGALDNMVTQEESKHAAVCLENGKLKIIQDFKHPIEKVDMGKLSKIILDFINK